MASIIEVKNGKVTIDNFETDDPDVVAYFENLKQQNKNLEEEFYNLLKLGALAAKAGNVGLSTDYVDKQVEKMKDNVLLSLQEQFGNDGAVVKFLEEHFGVDGKIAKELLSPTTQGSPINILGNAIMEEFEKIKIHLNMEEIKQKGTAKGGDFEEYCKPILEEIASNHGEDVVHTGKTPGPIGLVGDFVYTITNPELKIVLEMKTETGTITLPDIKKELAGGMENRSAQYGIFVSKHREAIPLKVGIFNEYEDNKLVIALGSELQDEIIHQSILKIAIGYARARLRQQSGQKVGIDPSKIRTKIQSIEAKYNDLSQILASCSGIEKETVRIRGLVEIIHTDIEKSTKEITDLIS
jgi:hypothetical protein